MAVKMIGASLPGDFTTKLYEHDIPVPGRGQVVVEMKTVTLCGSDKTLFRGELPFARDPMQIAGHEISGIVWDTGEGTGQFHKNDRVIVYHASGCGYCSCCRRGMVNLCKNSKGTYGFHKNGALAKYVLAEERDLIALPDEISFEDAAALGCSFSSGYSAVKKAGVCGRDAVFVSGLGPVGLGILMNAKAMGANLLIAADDNEYRRELALKLGIVNAAVPVKDALGTVETLTMSRGVEKSFDASGSKEGRSIAVKVLREYGHATFMGEGSDFDLDGGSTMNLIHGQRQISGSWAVPLWEIEELLEMLTRWNVHPSEMITHTFPLRRIDEAFRVAVSEQCGKIAITNFD